MAWRIGHNVVRGEIDNRMRGRVEGTIWLAGSSDPLVLRLTGDCHVDLAGCRLEFSNPNPRVDSSIALSPNQNGLVGDMTAARKVRIIEFDACDAIRSAKKPPERLANTLYLEWFSEINGRVVIESAGYEISASEPAWSMSPEEEAHQREANAEAMQFFLDRATGTPDAREEAAYHGAPKDEFEWELFLRASDRRVTRLGELLEKYHDCPDRDRLIARAMGWTEIAEMLEAELETDSEDEPITAEASPGVDMTEREDDPLRHPIVVCLLERSATLMKLVRGKSDPDLEEMVAGFMAVGPKVAGALGTAVPHLDSESALNGLAVARLKRALGQLSRALNAASRLKQRGVDLPIPIGEWVTEMLKIREELLWLMSKFRADLS